MLQHSNQTVLFPTHYLGKIAQQSHLKTVVVEHTHPFIFMEVP